MFRLALVVAMAALLMVVGSFTAKATDYGNVQLLVDDCDQCVEQIADYGSQAVVVQQVGHRQRVQRQRVQRIIVPQRSQRVQIIQRQRNRPQRIIVQQQRGRGQRTEVRQRRGLFGRDRGLSIRVR